jgi:prepilin-type processing-associated H-X9-DG protein
MMAAARGAEPIPTWTAEPAPDGDPARADETDGEQQDPAVAERVLLHVGGFGSVHAQGAHFAFGDGSVRFLIDQTDQQTLSRLAQRADGELVEGF